MNTASSAGIVVAVLALVIAVPCLKAQQQAPYGYPGTAAAAVQVPKSVLERYVGEWVYPDGNTVSIRLRGDRMFREIPGQQVPFVPISETRFRLGPVFTAEFVMDPAGGMMQILSDGAAVEFRLHRKGTTPAAPAVPAAAAQIPKPMLERYAGHYEYIPGQMSRTDLFVDVRLKGDALLARGLGQQDVVLTPISETRFKLGNTSIVWEFELDEAGSVTLTMGSGFQQMKARQVSRF